MADNSGIEWVADEARRSLCAKDRRGAGVWHPGPRLRGAADTSPVSACDCHLVPRPRPRDLPDPHCRRCLGSGEVARG